MAELGKAKVRHDCVEEIVRDLGAIATDNMWYGSIAICSCGRHFALCDDQREGDVWVETSH